MRDDLRAEFERRSLTQREVARRMGVDESLISHLFAGRRTFSILTARAMSWSTGIPLNMILQDGDLPLREPQEVTA